MNNEKEPTNFNEWYTSNEVQMEVKNCSIPVVTKSVCECISVIGSYEEGGIYKCRTCNNRKRKQPVW